MKETTRTIQVKAYTDDEGKLVCGKELEGPRCEYLWWHPAWHLYACNYQKKGHPGHDCPVWHGESKGEWQPIEKQDLKTAGYYWWLPKCFIDSDLPGRWSIISWHPKDGSAKEGVFVGPIEPPQENNHE